MKKILTAVLTVVLSLSGITAETSIYSENHAEDASGHFFYFFSERNPRDDYLKSIKATMLFYGTYEDHVEYVTTEYPREAIIDSLGRLLAITFDDSSKTIVLYTGGDLCSGMQFTKQEAYCSAKGKILDTLKDAKVNGGELSVDDFLLVLFDKGFLKFD